MHEIHIQLTEQQFEQVQRRAVEAGFATVDEYIVDVVSEEVAQDELNHDYRFTPEVIADLDRIRTEVQSGSKTYSPEEVDEHFRQKSQEWRAAHEN